MEPQAPYPFLLLKTILLISFGDWLCFTEHSLRLGVWSNQSALPSQEIDRPPKPHLFLLLGMYLREIYEDRKKHLDQVHYCSNTLLILSVVTCSPPLEY